MPPCWSHSLHGAIWGSLPTKCLRHREASPDASADLHKTDNRYLRRQRTFLSVYRRRLFCSSLGPARAVEGGSPYGMLQFSVFTIQIAVTAPG